MVNFKLGLDRKTRYLFTKPLAKFIDHVVRVLIIFRPWILAILQ